MRKMSWTLLALAAALAMVLGGCGFYHMTHKQTTHDDAAIKAGAKFFVRPISFSQISRPEDYESDQQWVTDIVDIHKEYAEEVAIVADEYDLKDKIVMATTNQEVTEGLLVEAFVTKLRREYNAFSGGFDFVFATIKVTDAASKKVLFEGEVETSSKRMGLVGWKGASFSGRLSMACWNVVRPMISVLKYAKIKPIEM